MKIEEMKRISEKGFFFSALNINSDLVKMYWIVSLYPDRTRVSSEDLDFFFAAKDASSFAFVLESQRLNSRRFKTLDAVASFLLRSGVRQFAVNMFVDED